VHVDELFVQLVEALDRDLELLDTLRYRLIVLGALAGADQGPSLPTAVREIELAHESLRIADLVRAATTAQIAQEFELDATPRIDDLASRANDAWGEVLLERRRTLIIAVTGLQSLATTVTAAMGRRVALAEEALAFLRGEGASTYNSARPRGGLLVEGTL
jgi:hypothetical protein